MPQIFLVRDFLNLTKVYCRIVLLPEVSVEQPLSAFVLHKRPYRETSFLVDVFTLEMGKLSFVAKGAQQRKGNMKALLQPFQALQITCVGKSALKTLSQCEASDKSMGLAGTSLYCGLYMNELLNRLLPQEMPLEALFHSYANALQQLAQQTHAEPPLREFEWMLINELGYGFSLEHDALSGANIEKSEFYQFVPEQGLIRANERAPGRLSGADLLAVQQQGWSSSSLHAAKVLMRQALAPLLGNKPLKSRELFKQEKNR